MYSSQWLHPLLGLSRCRNDRRRPASRQRRGVRPMLEALEDRLTPSTVTESAADAVTLQTDLTGATAANTQYVINLTGDSSAYNLAAGTELTVSAAASGSSVTIAGNGQSITGNESRVFEVESGANVILQNVTITGGSGVSQGGGIEDLGGNVTLSNATIEGNSVLGNSASLGEAYGGGVYVSGSGTLQINDSTLRANSAQGAQGANATAAGQSGAGGGDAFGGGVYVTGSGWNVVLIGDTLSVNTAKGGKGGDGAAGGNGGGGGGAEGGAAYFAGNGASLTILNDANSPTTNPSRMLGNFAVAGAGGMAGSGGANGSTFSAEGGAVFLSAPGATVHVGNTTFYGNSAYVVNRGGQVVGGAIDFRNGNFTMVNSTVANNAATSQFSTVYGGGIADNDPQSVVFDNNTITANIINGATNLGAGLSLDPLASSPTLLNNLIAANAGIGTSSSDVEVTNKQTVNVSYNFIGSIDDPGGSILGTNVNPGNSPIQLGGVVGVTAGGAASGGPIYFPLLAGTVSMDAGSTSVLNTIAGIEGTTAANATDEIGNLRSANGSIDLGAIQSQTSLPPSPPSSPTPPPSPPQPPTLNVPPLLSFINSLLGGIETVNADGTETITDSIFGIRLFVSTFDSQGNLVSVDLFGYNITFLFVKSAPTNKN